MPMEPPPIDLSKLDIERLISDVAKRHNLLLRPDDPLFITVTLNELLLARALERIEAAVIASQDQIAAGTAQQIATAKVLGERLITAAAGHLAGQVREAAGEAADRIGSAVAAELQAAREAAKTVSTARGSAWLAVTIAIAAAAIAATIAALSPLIDGRHAPVECRAAADRTWASLLPS
jgi:hypothetical protein